MWSANTYALADEQRASEMVAFPSGRFAQKLQVVSDMKNRTLAALMILTFWGVIALLSFSSSVLNDSLTTAPHLPLVAPLLVAACSAAIWAVLTPVIFWLTARCSLERPGRLGSVLLLMTIGLVISIGVGRLMAFIRFQQAMHYAVPGVVVEPYGAARPTSTVGRLFFLNEFEFYLIVMAAGFAYDYVVRYRLRNEEAAVLRSQLAESRLGALQMQLNPHFLFNSLNTVSSLVERDPPGARRMIARLADLLRDTLDMGELEVSLERELNFARRYIGIMQMRFEDRLTASEDIDPATLAALVPNLILQPLVENAIKHGIEKLEGRRHIQISAHRRDGKLLLSVMDHGEAHSNAAASGKTTSPGLGLKNTRARLAQSYGDLQSLRLERNTEGGVTVEVTMPFHTQSTTGVALS
jgi:two-component system LytT family sensor kinase